LANHQQNYHLVWFNGFSDEHGDLTRNPINGMKMGFGASFKVLADYLAQSS
jgi:hypothetical protein